MGCQGIIWIGSVCKISPLRTSVSLSRPRIFQPMQMGVKWMATARSWICVVLPLKVIMISALSDLKAVKLHPTLVVQSSTHPTHPVNWHWTNWTPLIHWSIKLIISWMGFILEDQFSTWWKCSIIGPLGSTYDPSQVDSHLPQFNTYPSVTPHWIENPNIKMPSKQLDFEDQWLRGKAGVLWLMLAQPYESMRSFHPLDCRASKWTHQPGSTDHGPYTYKEPGEWLVCEKSHAS